ncbi:exosome RNA helicase MTR4-like [Ctenocephalides felis]|uniref:exosome RNA helicase MTR4-like n=1 Tax=Ctenocephalides felis TaxID=7515 RepID=UPI000E6E4BBD|nr:exosome RNA helicase MTR4-like [Ctenocephalides felis]
MDDLDELFSCFTSNNQNSIGPPTVPPPKDVSEKPKDDDAKGTKRPVSPGPSEKLEESPKKLKMDPLLDDINLDDLNKRIVVHTIETVEGCLHEVAYPPGLDYIPLRPPSSVPAKEYPFLLDPFQKEAILCIENNQSVLVSAHTSAGKTVVAEYSIAKSLKDKQRVIYTTPIKALSNQKFREFTEEFKDVGLITGDVTINPTAACLIMTTEILRSMLYRGSEVTREVGWVIFDEIHYMRDKERGVVWEETLILLQDNVRQVFLSATIPNATQFAEWVCFIHRQPCHVVYTDYRPTPLQHYIFPAGGDGIHLVVDEKGLFKEDNFNKAMAVLANAGDAAKGDQRGRRGGIRGANPTESNIYKIVKMVMERNFAPLICFSFSKKECETYAMQMAKLDFNSTEEKKFVDEIFHNAIDVLNEEDKKLPQVENVLPLLKRGIGIHHGGLLPILKETIEILFAEGLIKALFATETFAMGLNMPARTVLFTSPRKFDGKSMRWISSGEYIQMSGRAGRRGLDDKGIVILMLDEKVSPATGKEIVQGKADPINSAFHLTYNMVLNLLRVEEINPEYMLEKSFYQFQNLSSIPDLYQKVMDKSQELQTCTVDREFEISSYHHIRTKLDDLGEEYRNFITKPEYLVPFLQPGRLVKVKNTLHEYDWGMVVNYKKQRVTQRPIRGRRNPNPMSDEEHHVIVDILLHIAKIDDAANSSQVSKIPPPCLEGETGDIEVISVEHGAIWKISSVRVHCPNDLRPIDSRKSMFKTIQEVKKRFPEGPPLLKPIEEMHIKDEEFLNCKNLIEQFEERLYKHPLHKDANLDKLYNDYTNKLQVTADFKSAKQALKKAMSLLHMEELKCRKRVLRRLGYCTPSDVIEIKGRVACELSSADELLMTEMMFEGIFNGIKVEECLALLSCFVCDEKSQETQKATETLSGPLRHMHNLARKIAKVSKESKIEIDEEAYIQQFKPHMMDVVIAWCRGSKFAEICKMTDIFEGSIIRCMRRLEELLRQMIQAAKSIGNTDLEIKFSEGIQLLKRDIVFAASLYL